MEQENKTTVKTIFIVIKKVLFWLALSICVILAIIASWLCIDKFIIGSKVPSFCGYSSLFVSTGSMSGTIEENDIIIIKKTNDYKIGDIITFIQEGDKKPTTHRIIGYVSEGVYVTKGDANNTEDRVSVKEEEIIGEVVKDLRGLSLVVGWTTEGGGYIYILAIVLTICFGVYFIKHFNTNSEEESEEENNESQKCD